MTSSPTPVPRDDLEFDPRPPSLFIRPEQIDPFERGNGVTTLPYVGAWNTEANHISTGVTTVAAGSSIQAHTHNVEETVVVLEGSAVCDLEDASFAMQPGDATWIPADTPHAFRNTGDGPLRVLWCYAGRDVSRTYVESGETVGHLSDGDKD